MQAAPAPSPRTSTNGPSRPRPRDTPGGAPYDTPFARAVHKEFQEATKDLAHTVG